MKRVISIVITLCLTFSMLPVVFAEQTQEVSGPHAEVLAQYVDVQEFKAYLTEQMMAFSESIDLRQFALPKEDAVADALYGFLHDEMKELFHAQPGSLWHASSSYVQLDVTYTCTPEEYETKRAQLDAAVRKMLMGIQGNTALSDVEKALLLHDRLAVRCEYDLTYSSADLYSTLVGRTAVCDGYAKAYGYLLDQVGISNYYCASELLNHAWNIVYIDGVPYHVDVTWDDKIYDKTGNVSHENFLRSSNGFVETGHVENGTVDYDTTPTDTRYDDAYWQTSQTAFQVLGGEVYYIDNAAQILKRADGEELCSVADKWKASATSSWAGNFARLSSDGEDLLFSLSDGIYSFDVETNTAALICSPDLSAGDFFSIYGFAYESGNLICDLYSSPNFASDTKAAYQVRIPYEKPSSVMVSGSCGDDLTMRFHVLVEEAAAADGYMRITVGSDTPVTVKVSEAQTDEDGYYIFTVSVAAAQMNDTITLELVAGGETSEVCTYSVRQYADSVLADESLIEYHALVKAMLNYGAKAQTYFGYHADALANDGITAKDAVVPAALETELAVTGRADGICFYGATLVFGDKTAVRYYFNVTGNIGDYTFMVGENSYQPVEKDGRYYVEVPGVDPQDLDEAVTLTAAYGTETLSVTYCPLNYIVNMYHGSGSDTLKTLLQALYGYYMAAEAFAAQ